MRRLNSPLLLQLVSGQSLRAVAKDVSMQGDGAAHERTSRREIHSYAFHMQDNWGAWRPNARQAAVSEAGLAIAGFRLEVGDGV